MAKPTALAVILAAGDGTRMRSSRPKVLHEVGGLALVGHVLKATAAAGFDRRAVVVGAGAEQVAAYVAGTDGKARIHEQKERLGTAHAALAAERSLKPAADDVVVLFGDTPLITPQTLRRLKTRLARGADVVVAGFRPADPTGYGRLILDGKRLVAIREEPDASAEEKRLELVNGGIMGFAGKGLVALLKKIGNDNARGEYYLTDVAEVAHRAGKTVAVIEVDSNDVLGVNSRTELAEAEALFQHRARSAAMAAGVTMTAPETVWFSHDTQLARDVTIEPNVFFAPGVSVGAGATIRANCHLEGATIAAGATVGPFARLRPGAAVGAGARIGNFVEVKNADIGRGAKVPHLTYVGDASVGAKSNLGAGTITCNYDGFAKHRTVIGESVFVGSNTSLIAPVTIGDGGYVASGSVVTRSVASDAMAIARCRQTDKPDWARKYREHHGAEMKVLAKGKK